MNKQKDKAEIINEIFEYVNFIKDYNAFPLFNDGLIVGDILKRLEIIKAEDSPLSTEMYGSHLNEHKTSVSADDTGKVSDLKTNPLKEKVKSIKPEGAAIKNLTELNSIVSNCTKCSLLSRQRNNVVFGSGNMNADLVIVGEAPGAEEDKQGLPFVGRAGKLLTDILNAINFTRDEVYICNILKCRPPENRNPMPDEIENCEPYLFTQLKIIKPKLILALGTFASQTLLRSKEPLGRLRGRFHTYEGIKMMVTYHPAALLRNPNWKKPAWEDVKMLRAEYDKMKTN